MFYYIWGATVFLWSLIIIGYGIQRYRLTKAMTKKEQQRRLAAIKAMEGVEPGDIIEITLPIWIGENKAKVISVNSHGAHPRKLKFLEKVLGNTTSALTS